MFTAFGSARALAAGADRPKLVVGIVVDQMRWDYLYRYYDMFGEGGFRRLMNEGFSCENTMINYVPSITAVGHASIYTGTVPAIHGIAGNNFLLNGKMVYCCSDSTVSTVGSKSAEGKMSPRNMLTTTIGDELKIATLRQKSSACRSKTAPQYFLQDMLPTELTGLTIQQAPS